MKETQMNETILCPKLTMSHAAYPSLFSFHSGIIVCVMNGVLAIPTTILNLLLILSILTAPNLRRPSYILICALGFCDFGIGFLVQPLYIARKIAFMTSNYETYCRILQAGNVAAHLFCTPAFFIVTAISVDRYLAIHLKSAYTSVVTIKVVLTYLGLTFLCAGSVTAGRFRAKSPKYMSIAAAFMFVVLAIVLYCYCTSLKALKTTQQRVTTDEFKENSDTSRVSGHRRVLTTLFLIVTMLFCCYVPFVTIVVTMAIYDRSKEFMVAWEMGLTLLYLNSFLNPVIHFARLYELRAACATVVKSR